MPRAVVVISLASYVLLLFAVYRLRWTSPVATGSNKAVSRWSFSRQTSYPALMMYQNATDESQIELPTTGAAAATDEGTSSFGDWEKKLSEFRDDPLHGRLSRTNSVLSFAWGKSEGDGPPSPSPSERLGSLLRSNRRAPPPPPPEFPLGLTSYLNGAKFGSGLGGVPPITDIVEPTAPVVTPPETPGARPVELPRPQRVRTRIEGSGSDRVDLNSVNVGALRLGSLTGPWASSTASLQEPEGRLKPASSSVKFEGPAKALALGLPGRVWAILASRSPLAGDGKDSSFSMVGLSFEFTAADQTLTRNVAPSGDNLPHVDVLVKGGLASRAYETARTLLTGGDSIDGNAVLREVLVFERLMQALDEIKDAYPGWFFERTGTNGLKAGCVYSFPQGGTDNAGILTIGDCVAKAGDVIISGNRTWDEVARSALHGTWGIWLEGLSAGGYAMSIAVVLLFTWASVGGFTNPPLPSELDVIAEAASSSSQARDLSGQPGGELLTAVGLLSTANAGRVTVHGRSLGLPLSYSGRVTGRDLRVFCAKAVWRTCIDKAEEARPDLLVVDMRRWGKDSTKRVPVLMVGEGQVEGVLASLRGSEVVPGVTLVKTSDGWKNAQRSGEGRLLVDKDWGQVDLLIGPQELITICSLYVLLLLTALGLDVPEALLEVSLVLSAVYRPNCLLAFHLDCLTGWQGPEILLSAFLVLWTVAVVTDGPLRTTGASMAFALLVCMQVWRGLLCYGPKSLRFRAWRVAGTWGFKRAGARCGDIGVKHVSDFVYVHMKKGSRFPAHTTSRPGILTFGQLAVCGAAPEARGEAGTYTDLRLPQSETRRSPHIERV